MKHKFILASNSPRRRELLSLIGLKFTVVPAEVEEKTKIGEMPEDMVKRLSCEKASDVAARFKESLILAADTVVVSDGKIFGKPKNESEARYMLRALAGVCHQVYTGVTVISPKGDRLTTSEKTDVFFRDLKDDDIENYLAVGEWKDKAGAYAIQGAGAVLVEHVNGCYYNVVGLPLARVSVILTKMGLKLSEQWGIGE
ncbi:MAG: Maf family protein [Synergistes sp.]|nr:Maf family protein [Synergistes sp.]